MAETDLISRQAALNAMDTWDKFGCDPDGKLVSYGDDNHYVPYVQYDDMIHAIKHLPSAQPDRDVIDDCLCHIYKNISVHTATGGVIAIRYYMEKLYEEIYGKGERPWWMT
jgi:hypothetical protein